MFWNCRNCRKRCSLSSKLTLKTRIWFDFFLAKFFCRFFDIWGETFKSCCQTLSIITVRYFAILLRLNTRAYFKTTLHIFFNPKNIQITPPPFSLYFALLVKHCTHALNVYSMFWVLHMCLQGFGSVTNRVIKSSNVLDIMS